MEPTTLTLAMLPLEYGQYFPMGLTSTALMHYALYLVFTFGVTASDMGIKVNSTLQPDFNIWSKNHISPKKFHFFVSTSTSLPSTSNSPDLITPTIPSIFQNAISLTTTAIPPSVLRQFTTTASPFMSPNITWNQNGGLAFAADDEMTTTPMINQLPADSKTNSSVNLQNAATTSKDVYTAKHYVVTAASKEKYEDLHELNPTTLTTSTLNGATKEASSKTSDNKVSTSGSAVKLKTVSHKKAGAVSLITTALTTPSEKPTDEVTLTTIPPTTIPTSTLSAAAKLTTTKPSTSATPPIPTVTITEKHSQPTASLTATTLPPSPTAKRHQTVNVETLTTITEVKDNTKELVSSTTPLSVADRRSTILRLLDAGPLRKSTDQNTATVPLTTVSDTTPSAVTTANPTTTTAAPTTKTVTSTTTIFTTPTAVPQTSTPDIITAPTVLDSSAMPPPPPLVNLSETTTPPPISTVPSTTLPTTTIVATADTTARSTTKIPVMMTDFTSMETKSITTSQYPTTAETMAVQTNEEMTLAPTTRLKPPTKIGTWLKLTSPDVSAAGSVTNAAPTTNPVLTTETKETTVKNMPIKITSSPILQVGSSVPSTNTEAMTTSKPSTIIARADAKPSSEPSTIIASADAKPSSEPSTIIASAEATPSSEPSTIIASAEATPSTNVASAEATPNSEPSTNVASAEATPSSVPSTIVASAEATPSSEPSTIVASAEATPSSEPSTIVASTEATPSSKLSSIVPGSKSASMTSTDITISPTADINVQTETISIMTEETTPTEPKSATTGQTMTIVVTNPSGPQSSQPPTKFPGGFWSLFTDPPTTQGSEAPSSSDRPSESFPQTSKMNPSATEGPITQTESSTEATTQDVVASTVSSNELSTKIQTSTIESLTNLPPTTQVNTETKIPTETEDLTTSLAQTITDNSVDTSNFISTTSVVTATTAAVIQNQSPSKPATTPDAQTTEDVFSKITAISAAPVTAKTLTTTESVTDTSIAILATFPVSTSETPTATGEPATTDVFTGMIIPTTTATEDQSITAETTAAESTTATKSVTENPTTMTSPITTWTPTEVPITTESGITVTEITQTTVETPNGSSTITAVPTVTETINTILVTQANQDTTEGGSDGSISTEEASTLTTPDTSAIPRTSEALTDVLTTTQTLTEGPTTSIPTDIPITPIGITKIPLTSKTSIGTQSATDAQTTTGTITEIPTITDNRPKVITSEFIPTYGFVSTMASTVNEAPTTASVLSTTNAEIATESKASTSAPTTMKITTKSLPTTNPTMTTSSSDIHEYSSTVAALFHFTETPKPGHVEFNTETTTDTATRALSTTIPPTTTTTTPVSPTAAPTMTTAQVPVVTTTITVPATVPSTTPTVATVPSTTPTVATVPSTTPTVATVPSTTPTVATVPSTTPTVATVPSTTPTVATVPSTTPTVATVPSTTPTVATVPSTTPTVATVPSTTPTVATVPSTTPTVATKTPTTTASITALPTTLTAGPTPEKQTTDSVSMSAIATTFSSITTLVSSMDNSTPAAEVQRHTIHIIGNFTISEGATWTEQLANTSSVDYKELMGQITKQLFRLWKDSSLGNHQRISDMRFAKGSVRVQYKAEFSVANKRKVTSKEFNDYFTSHLTDDHKLGSFTILVGSVKHTIFSAVQAKAVKTLPNWGIAVIVCGCVLLLFIVFMVCVLWSRRHIRQKFRIPEDPEDVGYRRNWLSVPPYTSPDSMYAYENKGVVPDCKDDIYKDPELAEKGDHPEPPHSDYSSSNGMDMNSIDDSTLQVRQKSMFRRNSDEFVKISLDDVDKKNDNDKFGIENVFDTWM